MAEKDEIQLLTHGGDWYGFQTEYGQLPLDFSVNINPLGMPMRVRQALANAAARADRYPDPLCRRLCRAISEAEGIPPEWILCGNGAADLIYRLIPAIKYAEAKTSIPIVKNVSSDASDSVVKNVGSKTSDVAVKNTGVTALIPIPSFSEYERAVRSFVGCVKYYPLDASDNFRIGEDILSEVTEDIDLVFVCQPNNPTGVTVDKSLLNRLLDRCEQMHARLLIDECFVEFLDEPDAFTMKDSLMGHPNLVILKAFTKSYAMAGVRLGYVLCPDPVFLETMRSCGQPWSVSILAEEAGLAALEEQTYLEEMRALIREERKYLKESLRSLGFRVISGKANFLLFQIPKKKESTIAFQDSLKKQGILMRSCANYPGLSEGWFRISVRTREENEKLIQAMHRTLK